MAHVIWDHAAQTGCVVARSLAIWAPSFTGLASIYEEPALYSNKARPFTPSIIMEKRGLMGGDLGT